MSSPFYKLFTHSLKISISVANKDLNLLEEIFIKTYTAADDWHQAWREKKITSMFQHTTRRTTSIQSICTKWVCQKLDRPTDGYQHCLACISVLFYTAKRRSMLPWRNSYSFKIITYITEKLENLHIWASIHKLQICAVLQIWILVFEKQSSLQRLVLLNQGDVLL